MVFFDDFVEIVFANLLSIPCTCRTRNVYGRGIQVLSSHTVTPLSALEFAASAKQCLLEGISLENVPCGFGSMLSINTLAREN